MTAKARPRPDLHTLAIAGERNHPGDAGGVESSTPKRPRRTQAERRAIAERELLTAALKLIAEKGVGRTTLAEIGEAAGYSRALPAVYFRDKNGLVKALWEYVSRLFARRMKQSAECGEGLDAVLGFVDLYLTRPKGDSFVFRASQVLQTEAFTSAPEIRESVAQHNHDAERYLRAQIRAGMKRGEIRGDVDPGAQAIMIIGALRGAVSHWLINPKINLETLRKEILTSIRRSLAP